MSSLPTDVQLEIYLEEGSSTKFGHLYDNGLATIPVTVFYKVTNGTAGTVGVDLSTNVTTLTREPADISGRFGVTEAPQGVVSTDYHGHYLNEDQAVMSSVSGMSSATFFLTCTATVTVDMKNYLMAYIKVPDYQEDVSSPPVSAVIYSNMSYGSDISNYDQVEIIRAHKPTINLTVMTDSSSEHTFSSNLFNWCNFFFIKAWYDDGELPLLLRETLAMFYEEDTEITPGTYGDWNRGLTSYPDFCAAVAAETDAEDHKWLSRCVSNGVSASGTVVQYGSSDGDASYDYNISSPFVGSFVTFCVDRLGSDVFNYYQYTGKATFYITDVYGSQSRLSVLPTTEINTQEIDVDYSQVTIIHP